MKRGVVWGARIAAAAMAWSAQAAIAADDTATATWKTRIAQLAQPAADEVVMTAVGDAIWTHKISTSPDVGLRSLFEVMRAADIAFLNHEQVLADSGYPTAKEIAKADPSIVDELTWAGVDMVSIANNHLMDFGPSGMETTLKTLDKAGIKYSGAGFTPAQAYQPAVVEKKGLKVALVAVMVSPTLNIGTAATEASPGVAWVRGATVRQPDGKVVIAPWDSDLRLMEDTIKAARKTADLVAVSMHIHWGGLADIDAGKQLVTRAAVDAGADIILGHGPHVVNGIEFYKGKPIVYSAGNFAFQFPPGAYEYFPQSLKVVQSMSNVTQPPFYEAVMLRMILSAKGEIRRMELLPVGLSPAGDPYLESGEKADAVLARVQALSKPLGTGIKREDWYAVVEPPKAGQRRK